MIVDLFANKKCQLFIDRFSAIAKSLPLGEVLEIVAKVSYGRNCQLEISLRK